MTNRWKKTGNALENFAIKKSPAEAGQKLLICFLIILCYVVVTSFLFHVEH